MVGKPFPGAQVASAGEAVVCLPGLRAGEERVRVKVGGGSPGNMLDVGSVDKVGFSMTIASTSGDDLI